MCQQTTAAHISVGRNRGLTTKLKSATIANMAKKKVKSKKAGSSDLEALVDGLGEPKLPKRAKRIALFNHKGGVSKTTTTFHLGWMLAQKGKRVVVVDADPQCNLSGLILGYRGQSDFEDFYKEYPERNIRSGLSPAFESRPKLIDPVECVSVPGNENLFLLPGHIGFSEYEVTLGIAQELTGSIQTLQNLPGSISYLLKRTAESLNADFVLVDMNPSLSSINQNILMTSDFFLLPTSPDYFSVMAVESLSTVLPRWHAWSKQASKLEILRTATYPFPASDPRFLGTVVQNYNIRDRSEKSATGAPSSGKPAKGFKQWIEQVNRVVEQKFVPMLEAEGMLIGASKYQQLGISASRCLAEISNFNSLIAKSQEFQTPVYALTQEQIGLGGVLLERTELSRDMFRDIFSRLADIVIKLMED